MQHLISCILGPIIFLAGVGKLFGVAAALSVVLLSAEGYELYIRSTNSNVDNPINDADVLRHEQFLNAVRYTDNYIWLAYSGCALCFAFKARIRAVRLPCGCTCSLRCAGALLLSPLMRKSCPHCGKVLFKVKSRLDALHIELAVIALVLMAILAIPVAVLLGSQATPSAPILQGTVVVVMAMLTTGLAMVMLLTAYLTTTFPEKTCWQVWWDFR